MPLYEFVCAECGKPFEQLVLSAGKVAEVTYPACQSLNVTRKISTFAPRFSGGSSTPFANSYSSSSCGAGSV